MIGYNSVDERRMANDALREASLPSYVARLELENEQLRGQLRDERLHRGADDVRRRTRIGELGHDVEDLTRMLEAALALLPRERDGGLRQRYASWRATR